MFVGRFFSWIGSLFGSTSATQQASGSAPPLSFNPDPDFSADVEDVPRYPPFDKGLPAIPVARVIDTQRALVDRISRSGLPYVDEAVRNLAAYVHLLPATSNDVFSGAGGLLRLCLETGFHSFVASQGNIFTSRDPAEKRRELEAKWQLAAFLAGLCCELGRAINTSVVTNDRGDQWLPFEPLTGWLERTQSQRYFLRPPQASQAQQTDPAHLSGIIVNAIIPSDALQHITTEDRNILMSMLGAISRISDTFHSGHFARTVRHIRDQVIERDRNSSPRSFGVPQVGVHVEPYLINAMRHLVKNGVWKRNEKLARVHLAVDGCFVFWTTGVPEILELLRLEGATGIPTNPRTLGELLIKSEVLQANGDAGLWWYIKPPGAATAYEVVKLSNPGIILEEEVIAATSIYPVPIVVPAPRAATASPPGDSPPASSQPAFSSSTDPSSSSVVAGVSVPLAPGDPSSPVAPPTDTDAPPAPPSGFGRALEVAAAAGTPRQASSDAPSPAPPSGADAKPATRPPKDRAPAKPRAADSSPPPSPAKPRRDPSAAPPPAQPATHTVPADASMADRIKTIRPSVRAQINQIRDWHNDADSSRKGIWSEKGLSIPIGLIQEAGGERGEFLTSLKGIKAVVFADGKSSLIHKSESGNLYFMIDNEAATEFGFERAQATA